jgi:hypothetical protein
MICVISRNILPACGCFSKPEDYKFSGKLMWTGYWKWKFTRYFGLQRVNHSAISVCKIRALGGIIKCGWVASTVFCVSIGGLHQPCFV